MLSARLRAASRRSSLAPTGSYLAIGLAVLAVALACVLAAFRVSSVSEPLTTVAQAAFVATFAALTLRDFRLSFGLMLIELAVGGASGGWTWFAGGAVSGRIFVLAVVFIRGGAEFLQVARRRGLVAFGAYGIHAAVLAIGIPLVWIPLGVLNSNGLKAAVLDGNGYAFLAFVPIVGALLLEGHGPWLRRAFVASCLANVLFTSAIVAAALMGLLRLYPDVALALGDGPTGLGFGGGVGYMPSGAGRLYLASGLYLQVALSIIAWKIVQRRTDWWLWPTLALTMVDIAATYTRGFWLASIGAVAAVVVFGARGRIGPLRLAGAMAGTLIVATFIGVAIGASVPDYILQRASSTLQTHAIPTVPGQSSAPGPPIVATGPTDIDVLGQVSNEIKIVQARVLLGHIVERPFFGFGFGSVAADYPYGAGSVYELSYLDVAYKTGIVGLLLFMSFPVRLLLDSIRVRIGRRSGPPHLPRVAAAIPVAVIASVLLASATNPYLFAAYGLAPIIMMVVWLDPLSRRE